MPIARIYQSTALAPNKELYLSDEASHHVARVLRARLGDQLVLFNGHGGEYTAVIQRMDKKSVAVTVTHFIARDVESPLTIHLAQGIARGEKMDFIVQKAVELGVKTMTPLMTERCNVQWDDKREEKRLQHWQNVAISACEQSGRNYLPTIFSPCLFVEWLKKTKGDLCLVLSPHVHDKLPKRQLPPHAEIVLVLGPEGGLSDQEIQMALQQGFLPWNLGPRILRTETATLAALSTLQFAYGDFS